VARHVSTTTRIIIITTTTTTIITTTTTTFAPVIPSAARNLLQNPPHLGSLMAGDSSLRSE
jgi:hypothetical protein